MKISPIVNNFTKASTNSPSFGLYASDEASDLAKSMLGRLYIYSGEKKMGCWKTLRDSEAVIIEKREDALWCKVNYPHFDIYIKNIEATGTVPETAALIVDDFTDYIDDPETEFDEEHPVKIVEKGSWGPITDPYALQRIAWATFLRNPNIYKDYTPRRPDETEPYYEKKPDDPYLDVLLSGKYGF